MTPKIMNISRKYLIVGGVALVIALILTITLVAVLTKHATCKTDVCKRTAERLKSYMDEDEDPCQNFYQFACGNFMKTSTIPKEKAMVGSLDDANNKLNSDVKDILNNQQIFSRSGSAADNAIRFYRGCKTSAKNEKLANRKLLINLLTELMNGTPLIPSSKKNTLIVEWSQIIARIMNTMDQNFMFSLQVLPDLNEPSKFVIYLIPEVPEFSKSPESILRSPQMSSPSLNSKELETKIKKAIYVIDENCNRNRNLISDIRRLINQFLIPGSYSGEYGNISISDDKYQQLFQSPATADPVPESTTLRRLQVSVPKVNWYEFFKTVFAKTMYENRIDANTKVVVFTNALTNIAQFLSRYSARDISIYFAWKLILKWGTVLFDGVRDSLTPFQTVEDRCLLVTNSAMGFAVGNLYHNKFITNQTISETENIVVNLKKAFRELVEENSWMDSTTKRKALLKVDNMVHSISTPDWAKKTTELDAYYKEIGKVNFKNFQDTFQRILKFSIVKKASLLRTKVDRRNSWPVPSSAVTNAFYYPNSNAIIFPSGILTSPIFEQGRPSAINYGSFGFVSGHEITHGFDNSGRTRDEKGAMVNWWSKSSENSFKTKSQCFVDQYSGILEPRAGMNLDGRKTLGENIADNGGVREAYRAFKNYQKTHSETERLPGLTKYDHDQLFFISAAHTFCSLPTTEYLKNQIAMDEHSPFRYRVFICMEPDING